MLKSSVQQFLLAALLSIGASSFVASTVGAEDFKVPVTVQDHLDLAKVYEQKATDYRKEVQFHKQMAETYKKQVPSTGKTGPNPWLVKMTKHCQMMIKDAEKLAVDAEKAADFHKLRAKEIEGK